MLKKPYCPERIVFKCWLGINASEEMTRRWEAGGVSMHVTLMFKWCIAQSQKSNWPWDRKSTTRLVPFHPRRKQRLTEKSNMIQWLVWAENEKIYQPASDFWQLRESCTSSRTNQSGCNIRDKHNKITTTGGEAETTLILGVLRDPQCESKASYLPVSVFKRQSADS